MKKAGEKYWAIVEPYADSVSIYDGADVFRRDFDQVPERPRNLLAAHWCVAEVCNGGFHQFFFNSTGVLAPESVAAFTKIGLPELGELVSAAMDKLGVPYPRDREQRQTALESLGLDGEDDEFDSFSSMDAKFYDLIASEGGGWETAADRYAETA
jgi:hypothetical protein